MPTVIIELPTLLRPMTGGRDALEVEASTLRDALEALVAAYPAVAVHLFDESGALREHVLCMHNGVNSRWRETMETPVRDGDVVTVLQAVSGG